MNIKLIAIVGAVIATAAGMFYAVNKTARKLEEENNSLPESQRKTREELDSSLDAEFRSRVAKNPVTKVAVNLFYVVRDIVNTWMDYRVKVALVGIILAAVPGFSVPIIVVRSCWSIISFEILLRTFIKTTEGTSDKDAPA